VAEAARVTTLRTLRNWQRLNSAERRARPGRPRIPQAELDWLRELVREQLELQGWRAGERPIYKALDGRYRISRVRRVLRELKAERRKREREHQAKQRVSVTVHARDAVWSLDATHLGRDERHREVQGEILREVASTRSIGITVGPAATAEEIIALLERAVRERGGAPLVLITDNAGAYIAQVLADWCRDHRVLHLFSLPYTPQHNAASEHGMRELKEDAVLGKGTLVHDVDMTRARLEESRDRIDGYRLRATRGCVPLTKTLTASHL